MRRSDRQILDFDKIVEIIDNCDKIVLGLNDEEYPYLLPLNFGYEINGEKITFYFHGANEGEKYHLIEKNNRASFEMDYFHNLVSDFDKKHCTMEYKSIIGRGEIFFLENDQEKIHALMKILDHYHKEEFPINEKILFMTRVFKMEITSFTAKARLKR